MRLLLCVAIVLTGVFATGCTTTPAAEPTGPSMEEWMKAQMPGEAHKWLEQNIGEWDISCKMWMPGQKEPMLSKGTSSCKAIMGGRFIEENMTVGEGEMAMQFHGFMGYDNMTEKFKACYISNSDTDVRVMTGKGDIKGNTLTLYDRYYSKFQKADVVVRIVGTFIDKDNQTLEMYETDGDKAECKIMELTYTRKK